MASLMARTVAGFAFLMSVLALALFLPAGSLRYWQAQAYLADFALCTVLITLYLIRHDRELLAGRVQVGPVAETQRAQKTIQSLASLFFLGLFVVPGLDFRYGWSNVPAVVSLVADGVVALGFTIVFLVFRANSYARATVDVSAGQRVITRGPYSAVRHPMYAGASLLVVATPVALGSWVAIPLAVLLVLVVALRLQDEEAVLLTHLSGYEDYRRRVRYRLIPWVW